MAGIKRLEEGQIVLCTVTKIVGTIVFVKIEAYGFEGTVTFAEIFPGKIRNIRDFVFPGKKIVCKVLRISPHVIELSLRRVKVSERNDFNDRFRKEKNYSAMMKTVMGEKESQEAILKIKENETSLFDFIESSKENPKILEKYMPGENSERISTILREKKSKEAVISKRFSISSKSSDGMIKVRETIAKATEKCNDCEVSYIAAGKYMIKIKTKDPKHADQQLRMIMSALEEISRKNGCVFLEEKSQK